jgi:Protein of unknown function (DUF2795)
VHRSRISAAQPNTKKENSMAMTNIEGSSSMQAGGIYLGQGRGRISWGAVFAGAVVAVATALLLNLLGIAMGGSVNPVDVSSTNLTNIGIGAGIWEIISLALAMAFGGYVAARLCGTHSHLDGELHGVTMWGVAVLLGCVLLAQTVASIVGLVGQGAGSVVSSTIGNAGAISGALPASDNSQSMINLLQRSLVSSGDPTTMTHEQIGSEITTLVGKSVVNPLSDADRNRLISLVAVQSGVTQEEAARRVAQMENEVKVDVAQVEQKTRVAAAAVARGAANAAWAFFTALVIGLLAALIGSWIGTRHKRVLHPLAEHHVDTYEPGYRTRTVYETGRPAAVSVYDETGRLVSQYLRGVTFPVSKQDLLRLARSGNAEPGVQHLIENMAEGSYANANEVFGALGMVH